MMTLNRVMAAGNLTRDPEIRQTPSGTAVGGFGLALNERFTTREGEEREDVCFIDIEIWGKQAEACNQYLSKGAPVFVEGRLRLDRWEDRDTGEPRQRLLVRADRVQFLGSPGRPTADAGASPAAKRARPDRRRSRDAA